MWGQMGGQTPVMEDPFTRAGNPDLVNSEIDEQEKHHLPQSYGLTYNHQMLIWKRNLPSTKLDNQLTVSLMKRRPTFERKTNHQSVYTIPEEDQTTVNTKRRSQRWNAITGRSGSVFLKEGETYEAMDPDLLISNVDWTPPPSDTVEDPELWDYYDRIKRTDAPTIESTAQNEIHKRTLKKRCDYHTRRLKLLKIVAANTYRRSYTKATMDRAKELQTEGEEIIRSCAQVSDAEALSGWYKRSTTYELSLGNFEVREIWGNTERPHSEQPFLISPDSSRRFQLEHTDMTYII
ncbi:hypothetical protein TREMEDRAFT_61096 [Tremella mesenterica DSM 1558]|uniref:uncharacterized protein n=1 Tax=Tremella mesenterica (strain ATCC 24925 / CBS 8224 / DSM 1558 / NBRC 9311 / NRRL Y-6157 / RJB 2259-6 / UBC 559-6) TaxID=578456 RepID=UPI0003F48EE1|nr:uncharacterized protein TREMEDRAFT_61096 [Tremella mesenterica DSM 1558]EIW70592.1 hypothetical protein TREMEDRAFT_61096 [Tremella mesenterica DSM 1558]